MGKIAKNIKDNEGQVKKLEQLENVTKIFGHKNEDPSFYRYLRKNIHFLLLKNEKIGQECKELIKIYLPDLEENSKKYKWIFKDALDSFCCHAILLDDYFANRCYEKSNYYKSQLISGKLINYYTKLNGTPFIEELATKSSAYEIYKDFYKRDFVTIKSKDDKNVFYDFLKKHHKVVLKSDDNYSGHGFKYIDEKADFDVLLRELNIFNLEELIIQDEGMAYFDESSLNTLRVQTINANNTCDILFILLSYGKDGLNADNLNSRGNGLLVDLNNGITYSRNARSSRDKYSNKQVVGIKIPRFDELKDIALQLAKVLNKYKVISFDLALDKNKGWVLVEASGFGEVTINEPALMLNDLERIVEKYDI